MPTAIIIGFEYSTNVLPGALVDIYQAHRWCCSFDCATYVFSDIRSNVDNTVIKKNIDAGVVGSDIMSFYDLIDKTLVTTSDELLTGIFNKFRQLDDDRLIIYYSGHGNKDALILPNHELLSFIALRDTVLKQLSSTVEIFWILDCCNPTGLHLPFILEGNNFVLSPSRISCVMQPILLIISSNAKEKSVSSDMGSLFTRHLFHILHNLSDGPTIASRNRNLRRLVGNLTSNIRRMHTGYAQTVSIYSSYVIDPILWLWIGSKNNEDVVSDMSLSTLVIR
jgi:hypothetical protein